MSTLYDKLGGKTLSELPSIPTNVVATPQVGGITLDWVNNNTLPDTTNVLQLFENSWMDKEEVASGATTGSITGLSVEQNYNIRVAVKKDNLYYPARTVTGQILPPPARPDNALTINFDGLVSYTSALANVTNNLFTWAGWVYYEAPPLVDNPVVGWNYGEPAPQLTSGEQLNFQLSSEVITAQSISRDTWYFVAIRGGNPGFDTFVDLWTESAYVSRVSNGEQFGSVMSAQGGDIMFGNGSFTKGKANAWGMWNSRLSDGNLTTLWNSGIGLSYSNLGDAGLTTDLVDYYDLGNSTTSDHLSQAASVSGDWSFTAI